MGLRTMLRESSLLVHVTCDRCIPWKLTVDAHLQSEEQYVQTSQRGEFLLYSQPAAIGQDKTYHIIEPQSTKRGNTGHSNSGGKANENRVSL